MGKRELRESLKSDIDNLFKSPEVAEHEFQSRISELGVMKLIHFQMQLNDKKYTNKAQAHQQNRPLL